MEFSFFLLDNIYIIFGTNLFRQIVGIPMGTNYAPLVADLFLFCYERAFMMSLSEEKQSEIIEAFSSMSNLKKKGKRKSPGTSRSQSKTPRGRGNRQNQTNANRTNVRKALSSPSEVIATLKGLKNTLTK